MPETLQPLTAVEARILGVLIEKEKTTPDVYPLTVNSLTAGCNQKTSREPVMTLSESDVLDGLESLRSRFLILETSGASGRVMRYAHNFGKVYQVPGAAVALLAILMLRGPQTINELRTNCDRLHRFADTSSVEGYLEELSTRPTGGLVVCLPKQPGSREHRWAHLLCGELAALPGVDQHKTTPESSAALEERVTRLEQEVAELRDALARFQVPSA